MLSHGLKYDSGSFHMAPILSLPSRRVVLSLVVHTIYATKNPQKALTRIDPQQQGCIYNIWLPQVLRAKHCY